MIVGIGELLWDVYPDGRKVAGGAPFNFAFHCQQLGHPAAIVSRVGDDDLGRQLREEVRRLSVSDQYIQIDPVHPTGTVQVTLNENKVPTYTITENVAWDYLGEDDGIDEGFAQDATAVCFGTLALRSPASRNSVLQLLGPGSVMRSALRVFDINLRPPFVPNAAALRACLDSADWAKISDDDIRVLPLELSALREKVAAMKRDHEEDLVWIQTKGADGCELSSVSDDRPVTLPAVSAKIVDTVGAGDAFTAAMVCLHLEGRHLRECAQFANHYAARVCEHQGATPVIHRAEVERAAFGSP